MGVLAYPVDDPDVARATARTWRAARSTLGDAGAAVSAQTGAMSAAWEGTASRSAVAQLDRNVARLADAAAALDQAAAILDRYADAIDDARSDIDRLNVEQAQAEAERLRDIDVVDARQAHEAAAATTSDIGRRYRTVMGLLDTTAGRLGQRLQAVAARARPGWTNPDAGPAAVVEQNADDAGYVDWLTHLALTHPNLDAEQRLWILEHPQRFEEQFDFLIEAAANPALTDDVVVNYVEEIERRNTRAHLAGAFATHHLEFVDALLLPMVVATLSSAGFRQAQHDTQLVAAVLDAATPGLPPGQYTPSSIVARPPVPLGFLGRRDYTAFTRELNAGLQRAGFHDATVHVRGSSVTRVRYRDGSPFGSDSDIDLAIASPTAFARAQELGIPLRGGATRTGPISGDDVLRLGLADELANLNAQVGRPVSIMLYRTVDDIVARGPSIAVPSR